MASINGWENNDIPTLSEWGMIILALLVLAIARKINLLI